MVTQRDILANYFGRQRGNSNVFGGPQPRQTQESGRTTAPQRRRTPTGPDMEDIRSAMRQFGEARKQQKEQEQKQSAADQLNAGSMLKQGLGTVIGGAANAAGFLGRGVVAGVEELAKSPLGELQERLMDNPIGNAVGTAINPLSQIVNRVDTERVDDEGNPDTRSYWDRVTDPSYGYGTIAESTGNVWGDRLQGLAGDIVLDPLTYVGGAAAKTAAQTTGRAGREVMAATLARTEGMEHLAGEAAKRGVAYLPQAAREAVGVQRPGLFIGVGKNSSRIPGTERLGAAIEKGFANARVNTITRVAGPLGEKLRAVPELKVAQRIMRTGVAENGIGPAEAATKVRFYHQTKAAMKQFTELRGRELRELLNSIDERTARAITHEIEAVGQSAQGKAAEIRMAFANIRQHLVDAGVDVKFLGDDYVPHRWSKKGRQWLTSSPEGRRLAKVIGIDPTEDPALFKARALKGGEKIELPNGDVFEVPQSGSIFDINDAIEKQFGIKGALEDDARLLLTGYIQEAGRGFGLREAFKDLVAGEGDIVKLLDSVAVEQLDEIATLSANKKVTKMLDKVIEDRGKKIGARAAVAAEAVENLRQATVDGLERTVKGLGKEHEGLRKELKVLMDAAKDTKGEKDVLKAFADLRGRTQMQFDAAVKQLDDATEDLQAARAEVELAERLADPARQLPAGEGESAARKALREAELAEARLQDQMDMAVDAMERVDELGEQLQVALKDMQQWEEFADSPEHLANAAVDRFVKEETTRVPNLEKAVGETSGPWERQIAEKLRTAEEGAEFEAQRQARAAGRSAEIAQASGVRLDELKVEIADIQRRMSEIEIELRATGEQYVPLEMRSRRARLMKRLAATTEELKDAARKENLASTRQDRIRTRNIGSTQTREDFEAAADALLEAEEGVIFRNEGRIPQHLAAEYEEALPSLEAQYFDLGTRKMELEADLRDINDEYVDLLGSGKPKDFAAERAAKQEELLRVEQQLNDVEQEIFATANEERIPLQRRLSQLQKLHDGAINEAARVSQSKRWHEHLAKHPIREGSSPAQIRANLATIHKIEATEDIHYRFLGMREEIKQVPREAKTEVQLADEITSIRDRLDALPEAKPSAVLADASLRGGREVSDEEADVIAAYLKTLSDAQKQADQKVKQIQNQLAKDYPTVNQNRTRPGGTIPTKNVTDEGVEIGPQTLSKAEYDKASQTAKPVVASRRSGHMQRGLAQVEADELGGQEAIDDFVGELRGDKGSGLGLTDQTGDAADNITITDTGSLSGLQWDDQAAALASGDFTDPRLASLLDELEVAKEARLGTRRQYKNALRAYGLDEAAGDGFAYGRWGNVLLVDTSGNARWSTKGAISMTDKELLDEAIKAGVVPKTGRKLGHNQLATLLGWKARLYKPGTARYGQLPEGLVESVGRTSAKDQIRRMTPQGRRAVLSDAREAERFALEPIITERRMLEDQLRQVTEQLGEVRQVRQEAFAEAQRFADEASRIQGEMDRARRVAEGVELRETQARNARTVADRAEREAGVARVQAGGDVQRRAQSVAEASVRVQDAEDRIDALAAIEQGLGKREADELNALTVERAISGLKAGVTQQEMWTTGARKERVQKIANKVPKKLRKDQRTAGRVKKQLDDVKAVLDDAAAEGTPESVATAELLDRATTASLRMQQDIDYRDALRDQKKRIQKANRVLKDKDATPAEKLAAAQQSPVGAVMKLAHDGMRTLESTLFPEGADHVVSREVHRMLTNFDQSMAGGGWEWLKYYDEANQFFKTWATTSPGFHLRNYMSATFMNMTEGVGVAHHFEGRNKYREYMRAVEREKGSPGALQKWWDNELTDRERNAFSAVFGSGAGGHFEAEELGELVGPMVDSKIGWMKNNPVTRFSKHWGADHVEGPVRLSLALHYADRGADTYSMKRAIDRIHFDYADVSEFDRQMKRIIPFWTFMSRNLPLQFEQMWTKPKAYSMYSALRDNFGVDEEGEGMPEWLENMGAFTVARDIGWLGGSDMVLNPDLPMTRMQDEVTGLFDGGIAASASPFLRVPVELKTNHSFFFDGPLSYEEGGLSGGEQALYALRNTVPLVGTTERLTGQGNYKGKELEKATNWAGLPIRGVSDEQRRRALLAAAGQ